MPYKDGDEWVWGNHRNKDKDELRQTVWGIWHQNGEKGDFGKFWETGKEASIDDPRTYLAGMSDGLKVYAVDADSVKLGFSPGFEFIACGDDSDFIPDDEIWIDEDVVAVADPWQSDDVYPAKFDY